MKVTIKKKDLFWYIYCALLALPYHASNSLLKYVSITNMISIFHIILLLLTLFLVINEKKKDKFSRAYLVVFAIGWTIAFVSGLYHGNSINNVIGDGGMYLLGMMIYTCASSSRTSTKMLDEYLFLTYKCAFVCSTISILMYLTRSFSFWGMISFNGGRYFGGFVSIFSISIPYAIFNHFTKGQVRLHNLLIHIVLGMACVIISQSRTVIITTIIGAVFAIYFSGNKLSRKRFFRVSFATIIGIAFLYWLLHSNFAIVNRLLSTDLSNRSETTNARLYIYQYYISKIMNNLTGYGFGSIMFFLTPQLNLMKDTATYTVDAALMATGYKGGIILLAVYVFGIIYSLYWLIKTYRYTKERIYFLLFVLETLFLVQTCLLTGQIIHTYATLTFFWTTIGLIFKSRSSGIYEKTDKTNRKLSGKI